MAKNDPYGADGKDDGKPGSHLSPELRQARLDERRAQRQAERIAAGLPVGPRIVPVTEGGAPKPGAQAAAVPPAPQDGPAAPSAAAPSGPVAPAAPQAPKPAAAPVPAGGAQAPQAAPPKPAAPAPAPRPAVPGPAPAPAKPAAAPAQKPAGPAALAAGPAVPAVTRAAPPATRPPPPGQAPAVGPAGGEAPPKPGAWAAALAEVQVRPLVSPARMQPRHRGLVLTLLLVVALPLLLTAAYLWVLAQDQYASKVGFTVRQEETASAGAVAGGLAQMLGVGSSSGSNARVLYEYIQSQDLVARVDGDVGLVAHYARNWPHDPLFSLWPDATIEDLTRFWSRMVRISYDEGSGLIEVEVRAHDPAFARSVATQLVAESQAMINQLNDTARRDAMAWAQQDLDQSVARLRAAREALTSFRATTQIVDPAADIQGRMGILTSLQEQLAQALVDLDLLTGIDEGDPRRRQLQRRIEVIRERIAQERQSFAAQDVTISETDYPTLIARYESLLVDQEVAEATYRAAQAALDAARSRAERQTLYLATYIRPTLAQKSEYPDRPVLLGLVGFFLLMLWSVLALVYYSLRDRG